MRGLVLVFLLCPVLGFASEQWTEVKSAHFTVITDAGEKRGREVALRFEQMRQVFGSLVMHGEVKTSHPVQILGFKNTKGIKQMAPLFKGKPIEVAGLYQKGQSQDFIALDLSTEGDYRWQTVFHEYAHLLLNSNTSEWPVWFDEGFAELFSTIDLSGKQALIGRAPESAVQMIANNRLVPVAQLFAVQHDSATYNESGDHRNMFYAESWLIVHYLEDKQLVKPVILSFALAHGRPDEAEFRQRTGMSFAEFDRALESYVRGNKLMGWNTPLPTAIDASSFDARALTANDALVAVAEMHAASPDHRAEAMRELEQALTADPNNMKAQSDLGYAYLMQRDYAHAEPYLEKAAGSGSQDAMVHFYYAMLLQQKFQASSTSPDQLERQKKELEEVIKLNPNLAEAYNLLALNAHQRQDSAGAIDASLRAVALDRRNQSYAVNLANAYLTAQKIAEAQAVINQLRGSQNLSVLTAIASMQSYISQYQSYQQAVVNYKKDAQASEQDSAPEAASAPRVALHRVDSGDSGTRRTVQGTLVQIDCKPDGSGALYMQDGERLLQLKFHSFSSIVDPESDTLTCWTKQKQATVEYTVDGVAQKVSLSK
jgi:tetratricopeptide (TPR) repeat protein